MSQLDELDRKILRLLQEDCDISLDALAKEVGSSKTPVWNRINKMRKSGVIRRQVAIVDPEAVGLGETFFVSVRTSRHDTEWLEAFTEAVLALPEILEVHRLTGDIDYLLKVQVSDAADFDRVYRALIDRISIFNVTSSLSMETIKSTTALNL
ncbi:MAG: Lrp/AsnC family transcriptional regulator [Alphaproteobacteria bacterium]|nr:Lrp/AsnC family transcriptional regulator [Alphaproteobacteria bacterium]